METYVACVRVNGVVKYMCSCAAGFSDFRYYIEDRIKKDYGKNAEVICTMKLGDHTIIGDLI